uniref:SAP domain-containing protein n=1 Tax=Peronospora matthiolae TaxID=2874970 RepID=A0AAV1TD65_9STRA
MTLEHAAPDALTRLKVKDLQRELKKRGLDASGLKAVLLQRLKEHVQQDEVLKLQEKGELEQEKMGKEEVKEENEEMKVVDEKVVVEDRQEREGMEEEEKDKENVEEEQMQQEVDEEERTKASDCQENEDIGMEGSGEQQDEALEVDGEGGKSAETGVLKRHRGADNDQNDSSGTKRPKLDDDFETSGQQLKKEDQSKTEMPLDDTEADEKVVDGCGRGDDGNKTTIRIDNFVRPFTLNAVKALVRECGPFVEGGFWMDAIKTHCFVTYTSSEIAESSIAALDGKLWPPENGRSLKVKFVDHTAVEVAQLGEANIPSQPKRGNNSEQAPQRPEVTIDEFFLKTETKPVLYYLPLTDEQIKQKKERQRQPEGQPRKRRHRGGRKRNRRARFQRR